jgi:hypothetical protein
MVHNMKHVKKQNVILVQMKREDGTTITTFNGEPHHAELLNEYITDVFTNQTGGITIWIEVLAGKL